MDQKTLYDTIDPEILTRVNARQEEISKGASINSKLAAALALGSIPVALAALTKDVFAQAPSDVLDVLQFALLLEQLEAEFYDRGVAASGLIDAGDMAIFAQIKAHEDAHVTAIQALITGKGATPNAKPTFDFTAHGAVAGFNFSAGQYETFKALAQAFEDTGVRAYKGQAPRLINDKAVLTAALTIHAVEARHASEIRRLRGLKGWITGASRDDLPAFTQGIYDGEDNVMQGGVDVSSLSLTASNGGVDAATEAFDEPLTKAQVTAIVMPFIATS
ncbi:MAG: ferritin-like domain-containing protein [Gemmatimonadaceae bacterium]|nr:ferritin-like domain-containing protein [Gemmatimonadaceae bacterium]